MSLDRNNNYILKDKAAERYFDINDALLKFFELFKYNDGDDRATVIIGGSFLDMLLDHILLAFFPENENEVEQLLRFDQPLGTFANKVRMAYCLGLIEKVVKDDLKIIGKIRNRFAHDLYASFDDQSIKNWCNSLRWHEISLMMSPPSSATTRDLYQVGVNQLVTFLNGAIGLGISAKRQVRNNY